MIYDIGRHGSLHGPNGLVPARRGSIQQQETPMKLRIHALVFGLLLLALALATVASDWRSPLFTGHRTEALLAFIAAAVFAMAMGFAIWRSPVGHTGKRPALAYGAGLAAIVAALALICVTVTEARFHWMRHWVLNAGPERLAAAGRHFIVGYRDAAFAESLASRGAVGGFFVTRHNVEGKAAAEIRREIDRLRQLAAGGASGHLWMASDQEGGGVSRLSPPLPRQPALSAVLSGHENAPRRDEAVQAYARAQGCGLAALGVDLNLAPVVDLNHQLVNPDDRFTRIFERAIGSDPYLVASTGRTYCRGLAATGVRCTLKHFPGIGRVYNDTHVEGAALAAPADLLAHTDWLPFRAIMAETPRPFVMLSHVRLTELDRQYPVSYSRRVVNGLLREQWGFDGVLITDDFAMRSVYDSGEGVGGAAVAALNAGVDLILISYDPDQYFPAMYAVLKADLAGKLDQAALSKSDARLDSAAGSLPEPALGAARECTAASGE